MTSKSNNDDLVVVGTDKDYSIKSGFNALKSSSITSPGTANYDHGSSVLSGSIQQKNFMAMNKEGISQLSNQITDMKDQMMINSPVLQNKKENVNATP